MKNYINQIVRGTSGTSGTTWYNSFIHKGLAWHFVWHNLAQLGTTWHNINFRK